MPHNTRNISSACCDKYNTGDKNKQSFLCRQFLNLKYHILAENTIPAPMNFGGRIDRGKANIQFLKFGAISRLRIVIGKCKPLNHHCRLCQYMLEAHTMHMTGFHSTIYFFEVAAMSDSLGHLSVYFCANFRVIIGIRE